MLRIYILSVLGEVQREDFHILHFSIVALDWIQLSTKHLTYGYLF